MAKGIYVGVDNKARKATKAYIGIDGKARKIKKGYIGVGGVAKLFYSSRTETTTSQLFFKFNSFSSGATEITGISTTKLQDGTQPTLSFTTKSPSGFELNNGTSSTTTRIYASVNNEVKKTVSALNQILVRDSYNKNYAIYTNTTTSQSYWYIREMVFDFKVPRTLTLQIYHSGRSSNTLVLKGSNDNSSWTTINSRVAIEGVQVTSSTAYRYYKLTTSKIDSWNIFYLYFTNIQDWIE